MTEDAPLVSFIVPTLNRRDFVLRAVDSCLATATKAGAAAEVVVVDSSSSDGSWELLQSRYGSDERLILVQNGRDAGPTASWLQGARLARGAFATFVWSDDYVSGDFLRKLLPALLTGSHLAVGQGLVRSAHDTTPLSGPDQAEEVDHAQLLTAYLMGTALPKAMTPVSPVCALFSSAAFDEWCGRVEGLSRSYKLRDRLLWKSAIGPDLLLFVIALARQNGTVHQEFSPVAQFSAHPGSITVDSDPWLLKTGYWVARSAAWQSDLGQSLLPGTQATVCAQLFLTGLRLIAHVPSAPGKGLSRLEATAGLAREACSLARYTSASIGVWPVVHALAHALIKRGGAGVSAKAKRRRALLRL